MCDAVCLTVVAVSVVVEIVDVGVCRFCVYPCFIFYCSFVCCSFLYDSSVSCAPFFNDVLYLKF